MKFKEFKDFFKDVATLSLYQKTCEKSANLGITSTWISCNAFETTTRLPINLEGEITGERDGKQLTEHEEISNANVSIT